MGNNLLASHDSLLHVYIALGSTNNRKLSLISIRLIIKVYP
jgi:hypothetical protein